MILKLLEPFVVTENNINVADDVLNVGDEEPAGRQVVAGPADDDQEVVLFVRDLLVLRVEQFQNIQRFSGFGDKDDEGKLEVIETEKVGAVHLVIVVRVHNDRNKHVEHDSDDHKRE